jgi:gliding motility-associated lipoprotein GldD
MKADEIFENYISKPGKSGIFYELDGSTATNAQFFITDSTHHFLRGALYFNSVPNIDSLKIVVDFIKKDILHLINTTSWKSTNQDLKQKN